jgi:alpha-N-acetylglucosamine transferase
MTDYDTLLVLDADTVVIQDIAHLFKLPIQFAFARQHGEVSVNGTKEIIIYGGKRGKEVR